MSAQPAVAPDRRCPTCGNQGIDSWHARRCAYLDGLRQQLEEYAAQHGVAAVSARDLFAHLRNIDDDGGLALRRAMTVIDLGWRPTTGVNS